MRVLQVISGLQRAAGTSVFCSELCNELKAKGLNVVIAVCDPDVEDIYKSAKNPDCGVPIVSVASILEQNQDFDLIHVHALWTPVLHRMILWARQKGIPYIISPHGMLTSWALSNSKWKKKLAMVLYQWKDLQQALMFHATADSEVDDIRRIGLNQPIVVAPLGVDLVEKKHLSVRKRKPEDRKRSILFVSRIHPKKGLFNLLEAWSSVRDLHWNIIIAGPDENNHTSELKSKAGELGISNDLSFIGPVYGEEKEQLYLEADVFVLPSYSENFGVVVLEALAAGLPVITTKETPWKELNGNNISGKCGWWIDVGVEGLIDALRDAMTLSDADRWQMGDEGRKLVEQKYSWHEVAETMKTAYTWVLEGGEFPDCIRSC